ncbi:MAG: BatA and WFA domain-containing protein [Chitinophagales bacterium]|nr:BatA and WFA domain-containing protein [Chitinophagales bacterium]MCZ2393349.1 BatA and WFA domain-containing protein [Chitinophagales bacterium]
MGFASPWILWALLAIAIPVVIHLFYFRRYQKIYFSDIRLLKEAIIEQKKSGKIRDLLILLAKILTILFLVLAFALPFLSGNNQNQSVKDSLVIYLDNSFSMSQLNDNNELLNEAKSIAIDILNQLDAEQKVMVLTNDADSEYRLFYSPEEAKKRVESIKVSPASSMIEDWNEDVRQLMSDLHQHQVHAIYISDFQKYAMPAQWDSIFAYTTLIPLQQKNTDNISLDTLELVEPFVQKDALTHVLVKIKNQGKENVTQLHLNIQDELVATKEILLSENASVVDTISFFAKNLGWLKGKVSIEDADLQYDNNLYFSVHTSSQNKVLLIEDVLSPQSIFQVFKSDPHFLVQRQSVKTAKIVQDYSLVVMNELTSISNELEVQLIDYVKNGGNVYIVPDAKNAKQAYNDFLKQLEVGQFVEWKNQAMNVSFINEQEPIVYMAFEKLPQRLDLPKVQAYWSTTSSYLMPESSILKLENDRPFIQKYVIGEGLVYLQTSPIDIEWSDFSSKAIFPPLVYNFAVVTSDSRPLFYTLGKKQLVKDLKISNDNDEAISLLKGHYELIPALYPLGQKIGIEISSNIKEDGNYLIQRKGETISELSCNFDRKESEMQFLKASELKARYSAPFLEIDEANHFLQKNSSGLLKSATQLWKICLILAIIFLIVEIFLVRYPTNKSSS